MKKVNSYDWNIRCIETSDIKNGKGSFSVLARLMKVLFNTPYASLSSRGYGYRK
jgi:hypothetical protein